MDYVLKDDGKIHTRYTELLRCTPKQIQAVLTERQGKKRKFSNSTLRFGTLRHDMWRDESLETGKTPACFGDYSLSVEMVEEELWSEIIPGVILHSRPDSVSISGATVVDYKTAELAKELKVVDQFKVPKQYVLPKRLNGTFPGFDLRQIARDSKAGITVPGISYGFMPIAQHGKLYRTSLQLPTYAYQLYTNGHAIRKMVYMVEVWRKSDLTIMGYAYLEKDISMTQIATHKKWLVARAELLAMAMRAKGMSG